MTSKKHGGLLIKILLFKLLFFQKILSCFSLCHKYFKKHLLVKALKDFSEYFFRQLKQHQHKIRSKTGISLEITLNVCKCLIVSLVLINSYFGETTIFVYFSWCTVCLSICHGTKRAYYTVPPGRRGTLFFLMAQIYTFGSTIVKKI